MTASSRRGSLVARYYAAAPRAAWLWLVAFALTTLVVLPALADQFYVELVAKIMIMAVFALSLDLLVGALTAGSLYALVAMEFNILYRPTNVFNFAQGDLVMLGAMFGATFITLATSCSASTGEITRVRLRSASCPLNTATFGARPEGGGVGVDEPALRWRGLGKGVDVHRGLAVHRRNDREVFVGAGYRPHSGLIEQDLIDVDTGRIGLGAECRQRRAVQHAGACRGQQGRTTQHQRARRYRHP